MKHLFYPVDRLIQNLCKPTYLASTGLRANFHELPKTLPYKAPLAGEILKGKYWEI